MIEMFMDVGLLRRKMFWAGLVLVTGFAAVVALMLWFLPGAFVAGFAGALAVALIFNGSKKRVE
jgi:hypothetical protein